jgi:hypothetical protein
MFPFHESSGLNIYDISGNYNHGVMNTVLPEPQWLTGANIYQGITGPALRLDGIRDRIDIPVASFPSSGSFSIGFWFCPAVLMDSSNLVDHYMFSLHDDLSTNGVFLKIKGATSDDSSTVTTGYLELGVETATTPAYIGSNASTWSANTWYHVIATYNSKTLVARMYVNGTIQTTSATATRGTTLATECSIGDRTPTTLYTQNYAFPGSIDLVTTWDYELSSAEIASIYSDPYSLLVNRSIPVTAPTAEFRYTRDQFIASAYRKIGIKDIDLTNEQNNYYQFGNEALNLLIKNLQNDGIRLWTIEWLDIPVTPSSVVQVGGVNYRCIANHISDFTTQPGIGSKWLTYWIADTSVVGGTWSNNEQYHCAGHFPIDSSIIGIERALWRIGTNDIPLPLVARTDYFSQIVNKHVEGMPIAVCFDQGLQPYLRLYPQPGATQYNDILRLLVTRKLPDMVNGTDNAPFWDRWNMALVYMLAAELSYENGIPISERDRLEQKAAMLKEMAKGQDRESMSLDQITSAYPRR